jgi:hypothetical protein
VCVRTLPIIPVARESFAIVSSFGVGGDRVEKRTTAVADPDRRYGHPLTP